MTWPSCVQCEIFVLDKEGHPPDISPEDRIIVLVGAVEQVRFAMTEITHILNNVGRHGQSESPLPQDGTSDESARFDDSRQMYTHDQHAYDGQDTFCEQQSCSGLYGFDPQNMTTYHQCMSLPAAQQLHSACFMPAGQQPPPKPFMSPYMVAQYAAPYQQPPSPQSYGTLCHQQPLLPHSSQWGPAQQPLLYSHQPYHLQQPAYQPHYQPVTAYEAVDPRVYQQSMAAPAATCYPAAQMYPVSGWGNAA